MNDKSRGRREFDFSEAIKYHYGKFPPVGLDHKRLLKPAMAAIEAVARYDQELQSLPNKTLLVSPLERQEAVISSRIEGTVTTLDELIRFEAEQENDPNSAASNYKSVTREVSLYRRALNRAQKAMENGAPLSDHLIRSTHATLLGVGRGARKSPGQYKTEQNYIAPENRQWKVLFIPIDPIRLRDGLDSFFNFVNSDAYDPLTKTAIAHAEFEALHPFEDGNGRIGRILVPLMLWKNNVISAPNFYVSDCIEEEKDQYIESLREVSRSGDWTQWCIFFFEILKNQAERNLASSRSISQLYDKMKVQFREILHSQWSETALDYIFERPVFYNNSFTRKSGIPAPTAARITRILLEHRLLTIVSPPSGRRSGVYAFQPLLDIVSV